MIGTVEWFPAGPIEIRDATIARVTALTGFTNVFGNRVRPTKSDMLPLACIWHMGDRTDPWGEANVGPVRLDHTLAMAIDVMVKAGKEEDLNAEIVGIVEPIRLALLTDPSWRGLAEAVTKADVHYSYPDEGGFLYARGVIEFELKFRSEWTPAAPNDFRGMNLTVGTNPKTQFRQSIYIPEPEDEP